MNFSKEQIKEAENEYCIETLQLGISRELVHLPGTTVTQFHGAAPRHVERRRDSP